MSAIAVIQARMSSTRLPGKVLMPLAGHPMIWHIYQRASCCSQIETVVVATSTEASDDALADFCFQSGLKCHRGPLDNVMQRFLEIRAQFPSSKYVVRITGDCPLIHPEFIDNQILALEKFDGDMTYTKIAGETLAGQGVHSWSSLEYINSHSDSPEDKEHVGAPYLSANLGQFRLVEMEVPDIFRKENFRITVDKGKDYELMAQLYDSLWSESGEIIDLVQAITWLKSRPHIADTNKYVTHSAINQKVQKQFSQQKDLNIIGKWEYASA